MNKILSPLILDTGKPAISLPAANCSLGGSSHQQWEVADGSAPGLAESLLDLKPSPCLNHDLYPEAIGSYDGDLFRAFHSDVAGTSFISAQNIDSAERKYAYLTYTVSADGNRLGLRDVNTKVIPTETEDSTSVQRLLENNLQNPALFNEEEQFTKEK